MTWTIKDDTSASWAESSDSSSSWNEIADQSVTWAARFIDGYVEIGYVDYVYVDGEYISYSVDDSNNTYTIIDDQVTTWL